MRNMKKNSLCVVSFASILLVALFVYSCSTGEHEYADEPETERNELAQSRAFSLGMRNSGNTLIDSIAISDEFWEFEMSSQLLADKFDAYASTLNENEYDALMSNLNDDDYTEEFIKKANLEKELQQMDIAKENLLQHTGFLRMSEEERTQLFMMYAESSEQIKTKSLKTRKEGGDTSKCEKLKEAAYLQAKGDYDNAIATNCSGAGILSACVLIEAAKYNTKKRRADREYEDCINNR